jgi:hypothetical protein
MRVERGLLYSMLGGMLGGLGPSFLVMLAIHFIKHTMAQTWKELTIILPIITIRLAILITSKCIKVPRHLAWILKISQSC